MRNVLALVALFVLAASVSEATTYYVRPDGLNAHAGTTNTAGGAWLTIAKGCQTAVAGDTVRVQAGTYLEVASGCTSGTAGNTVTLVADGTVTTCGLSFTSKSYIRVVGFTMDPSTPGCSAGTVVTMSGTNTGLEFWNDEVSHSQSFGYNADWSSPAFCHSCIWLGGAAHDFGNPSSAAAIALNGNDDFVGYMALSTVCYVGVQPSGNRQRMVHLSFSGFVQCNGTHPDFFYIQSNATNGYSQGVIESNFGVGTITSSDNKFAHAQNSQTTTPWNDDVFRQNVAYNMGSGYYSIYTDTGTTTNRLHNYNNSLVNCNRANNIIGFSTCGNIDGLSAGTLSATITNILNYQAWADVVTSGVQVWTAQNGATVTADYVSAFSPLQSETFTTPYSAVTHKQSNQDPLLTNVGGADFTLQSGSPARGAGGPLTTATSCSGTTLNVATNTGGFFVGSNASNLPQYGGAMVPGDVITVVSTSYQVASVSGDAITLTGAISCANGDAVYFGSSSTIDLGAYPYKAGGYGLSATYTTNAGTATIAPNDASLVRFVVCYDSNVPIAVVNASPYTCSVGSGTFSARAYPRYASSTQSVAATAPGALTLRAIKLKIRRDE